MVTCWRGAVGVAVMVTLAGGCGGGAVPTGRVAQAISGGVNDTAHPNVVGIAVAFSGGYATCTGSLILPNLVLTARHCVSSLSTENMTCQTYTDRSGRVHEASTAGAPFPARSFSVTTDQMMARGAQPVRVAQVIIPPNSTDVPICGKDIAMLRLATPITDVGLIEPRLDIRPEVGETFTAVGYGATSGAGTGSGTRRMREGLRAEHLGAAYAQGGIQVMTDAEWLGNEGTCQGDSGGPALDPAGAVFGVLSRGAANSCESQIYTRVDSWRAWIREAAVDAAAQMGAEPPAWAESPPAESAMFGDDCRSDSQCVAPLGCLVIGDRRRCTDIDCAACPQGWTCGDAQGYRACVPDPSFQMAPPDSGPVSPPDDAGTEAGSGDGGGMAPGAGGCATQPTGARGSRGAALAALALGLGWVVRRRRTRRDGASA